MRLPLQITYRGMESSPTIDAQVHRAAYLEVALPIATLGFVGAAALCKFPLGGDAIE